ncbi:MAG: class I SAM-dependent methyltransferase [Burkholderiaceae bacterium]|nr:MAG: class I SAM-dependent methyltransferase [Burkholderiaceae bacterium]
MSSSTCRVCGTTGPAEVVVATEKMFGLGGRFPYFRCADCGCLQIEDPTLDLGPYYPAQYYSLNPVTGARPSSRWATMRDREAVFPGHPLGRLLLALKPHAPLQSLGPLQLRTDDRIADVGCGAGHLLHALHRLGFGRLTGIDPHLAADAEPVPGLRLCKAELGDVDGPFDLIMFHHSLEHVADQVRVLAAARMRLAEGGRCLVRIPLVSSQAWQTYGLDWVQLDAPRHLYLHTSQSLRRLADRAGLEVESEVHDSSEFQFWGSEALRQGLPLVDAATGQEDPRVRRLAASRRREWRQKADELNREKRGDQAVFVLRAAARPAGAT